MQKLDIAPSVAIGCGGTGGHLFPGLAVAEELLRRQCRVTLLISPKEVDQQAVKSVTGVNVITLPAVGLTAGSRIAFVRGFFKSFRAASSLFRSARPHAALSMGGFTSAPPLLAAKRFGAKTFLHESNTIPGRANRWLAHWVDQGFVYFPEAAGRLSLARIDPIGMPIRRPFQKPIAPDAARTALQLAPDRPVLLVVGGSQGATGINDVVLQSLPFLSRPDLQFIHLTGARDFERVEKRYRELNLPALVRPFFDQMELALGAATLAISRAGASSLAELAALRVPALLIPYPSAADDHQYYNALAFVESGAAKMFAQHDTAPERLAEWISLLTGTSEETAAMRKNLEAWNTPRAAEAIAESILRWIAGAAKNSPETTGRRQSIDHESKRVPFLGTSFAEATR